MAGGNNAWITAGMEALAVKLVTISVPGSSPWIMTLHWHHTGHSTGNKAINFKGQ